jgi:hypothetical protein
MFEVAHSPPDSGPRSVEGLVLRAVGPEGGRVLSRNCDGVLAAFCQPPVEHH